MALTDDRRSRRNHLGRAMDNMTLLATTLSGLFGFFMGMLATSFLQLGRRVIQNYYSIVGGD
jgi:hypothetical protein